MWVFVRFGTDLVGERSEGGGAGEDGVDLEEAAGGGVAEVGFEVPEVEAAGGEFGLYLGHEDLAFVERDEGEFELEGEGLGEGLGGSGEDLGFVALDVELEEDAAGGGCG